MTEAPPQPRKHYRSGQFRPRQAVEEEAAVAEESITAAASARPSVKSALAEAITTATRQVRALLAPPPAPSILEQTPWPCGFYKFQDEGPGFNSFVEYFNPALCYWQGGLRLITRRRFIRQQAVGHNSLWMWKLSSDNRPFDGRLVQIKGPYIRENWEDPRAAPAPDGRLFLSWTNFRWNSFAHQCLGEVTPHLHVAKVIHPIYGSNGPGLLNNKGHEKNWLWFWHGGRLHMLYSALPHVVLRVEQLPGKFVEHVSPGLSWPFGQVRGGTPPVLVDNLYWTFFHSSLDLQRHHWTGEGRPPRRQYFMGAYAFEAREPFRVVRYTPQPLLRGSAVDPRNQGAPLVAFPGGSIYQDGGWLVVYGVNDCRAGWIRIPHQDLEKLTIPL